MFSRLACFLILANVWAASVAASTPGHAHSQYHRRHSVSRSESRLEARNVTDSELERRGPGARFSWYHTETGQAGACGKFIKNSDFAVARPIQEFNFVNDCFKQVTITVGGRTAVATVMDACMKCENGALDLSKGLFQYIAPHGDGIVHGSWTWGANTPKPPKEDPPKQDPPKQDPPKQDPPKKDDTTTTKKAPITTTKVTSTKTTSTETPTSTTTTASETTPTAALVDPTETFNRENNLAGIQDVLVRLGVAVLSASGKEISAA